MTNASQKIKEKQFQKAQDYAKSRGGQCLSTEYVTAKTKMKWKCSNLNHPEWESTFDIVVSRNAWCNLCYRQQQSEKSKLVGAFEKAQEYAQSRNGECLSTEYVNAKTKMRWKCDNLEHPIWESTFESIVSREQWCKKCAYDRAIIDNGYQLAQDYAKKHNGKCLANSKDVIKKHSYLKWKCDNQEHPEWETQLRNMLDFNTWCPLCAGRFSKDEYLEIAKKLAISKGGQCLSNKYTGQKGLLIWQCKNNDHPTFKTNYQNVSTKNYWCHLCKDEEKEPTREEFLNKAKEHAKLRGGECLSTKYKGNNEKLEWKCDNIECCESPSTMVPSMCWTIY
jgi:hypothetical protein